MKAFSTLKEMYESIEYRDFIDTKLGNDLYLNDPERADRIAEGANEGVNGSTHREVIEDWQEFLDSLKVFDPEYDDFDDIERYDLMQETYNSIQNEITACEQWHIENGSIDQSGF